MSTNSSEARNEMVHRQLIARGIQDRKVLAAMRKIPRHLFVAEELQDMAYDDRALPIALRQTISQPYMVVLMTEALELVDGEKVLKIGKAAGIRLLF